MKSVLALAAVAALVSAQNLGGQPACALPCLAKAIPQTSCAMADSACLCRPDIQAQLAPLVAGCLVTACTDASDLLKAQAAGAAACAAYANPSASAPAPPPATASSASSAASASTPWSYPASSMSVSVSTTASGTAAPTATANHTSSGAPHSSGTGAVPTQSVVPAAAPGAVLPVLAGGFAAVIAVAANL